MKNNTSKITREEVKNDVKKHFAKLFTEYNTPEKLINLAVDDIFECSGIKDEGQYTDGDVSLACQRVLLLSIGEKI